MSFLVISLSKSADSPCKIYALVTTGKANMCNGPSYGYGQSFLYVRYTPLLNLTYPNVMRPTDMKLAHWVGMHARYTTVKPNISQCNETHRYEVGPLGWYAC